MFEKPQSGPTDFERAGGGLRILLQLFVNCIDWVLSVRFLWHTDFFFFIVIFFSFSCEG